MIKKLGVLAIMLTFLINVNAQEQLQKIEASFIANFMRYIKWPEQQNFKSFTIGVYGKNEAVYKELLKVAQGKNVGLATIKVVEVFSKEEATNCQILFVPNLRSSRYSRDIGDLSKTSTLVITEEQSHFPDHSTINFKVVDNKLAFQLNMEKVEAKKIKVSTKLAQMAIG